MDNHKKVIPIGMIERRRTSLIEAKFRDKEETGTRCIEVLESLKRYENNSSKTKVFNTNIIRNYTGKDWQDNLDIISEMGRVNAPQMILKESQSRFINRILPGVKDISEVQYYSNNTDLDKDFVNEILDIVDTMSQCDRVLNNYERISSRFNFNQIIAESEVLDVIDTVESICELVDTYKRSVNARLNIALENILYLYDRNDITIDRKEVIQAITEYFLRVNPLLSDKQYKGIVSVLENNRFISHEDISGVYYLFNEQVSFENKIDSFVVNEKIKKEMWEDIKQCKNMEQFEVALHNICTRIFNNFIVAHSISSEDVADLLVFALYKGGTTISDDIQHIINTISYHVEYCMTGRDPKTLTVGENDRIVVMRTIIRAMEQTYNTTSAKVELANAIDSKYEEVKSKDLNNTPTEFHTLGQFIDVIATLESKDYADSDDVSDIIAKYKADQNKNVSIFKRAISKIYTKKPAAIIDGMPHVMTFIRNFGILSTLAISPVITVIVFSVDKIIEVGFKRKEMEKICTHFKSERVKIEKKISKTSNGEEKDRLSNYLACLDTSIEKLEEYRDSLYSDSELDRLDALNEATSAHDFNKLSIDEYFDKYHKDVCENVFRAANIFCDEVKRNSKISKYDFYNIKSITVEGDTSIAMCTVFHSADRYEVLKEFMTPEGIIEVPLFKMDDLVHGSTLYDTILNICNFVSEQLPKNYIINTTTYNNTTYISFNYLKCIMVDDMDHTATHEVREAMANILALSETVERIESMEFDNMMKDLCKHMDVIIADDHAFVYDLVSDTKCIDIVEYVETLKDLEACTSEYRTSVLATSALKYIDTVSNNTNISTLLESSILQAESLEYLYDIIEEAKSGNKKPVTATKKKMSKKIEDIKKSLSKPDKDSKDTKKKKNTSNVSITTTLGLAIQDFKGKIGNLSTKEKEISRNVDVNLSQIKSGIEKSLTTDRRESIIKGSILPSFSKTIKAASVAGATYLVSPVTAVIGTIGALACSKALTERERQILLDEIDIQLKVVDKQISTAESDGDMKEYKHLLTYQKKLQREYQRIRYNMKMRGKDNLLDTNKED